MDVGGECAASGILEPVEDIKAGIPRRVPGGIEGFLGAWRWLRALRLESTVDVLENDLMNVAIY